MEKIYRELRQFLVENTVYDSCNEVIVDSGEMNAAYSRGFYAGIEYAMRLIDKEIRKNAEHC